MTNPNLPATLQGIHVPDSLRRLYQPGNKDLTAGVASMPVLSIRGRAFQIKFQGQEIPLNGPNGYPLQFLDVILLKGSERFSKNFYPNAYVEGSDDPPACASADGIVPDPGVPHKQSETCATCRQNIWGSKVTPQGTQVKACSDSRRLAIVPAGAPMNEAYGGPMLLRVPPASLGDLQMYGYQLDSYGIPYFAVVTRLSFAQGVAFPKLNFDYSNPVSPDMEKAVNHWIGGDGRTAVENILRATAAQGPAMATGMAPQAQAQQPPPPVTPSTYAGGPVPAGTFPQHPPPPPQPQGFQPQGYPQGYPQPGPVYAPPGAPAGMTFAPPQPGWPQGQPAGFAPPPPSPASQPSFMPPPGPQGFQQPQQPQSHALPQGFPQPQTTQAPPPSPPPQGDAPRRPRGRPRATAPAPDPTAGPTSGVAANAATPSTPPASQPPMAANAAPPSGSPQQDMFQPSLPGAPPPLNQLAPQGGPVANGQMPDTVSAAPADLDAMLHKVLQGGGQPS